MRDAEQAKEGHESPAVGIEDWVIDVDTHITEPGNVWTDRLPARHQARAPRMVRNDDGIEFSMFRPCVPYYPLREILIVVAPVTNIGVIVFHHELVDIDKVNYLLGRNPNLLS